MEPRLDRIENKIDDLRKSIDDVLKTHNDTTRDHHGRITHLETTQKGVIALCLAVITTAFGSLAKALHLVP